MCIGTLRGAQYIGGCSVHWWAITSTLRGYPECIEGAMFIKRLSSSMLGRSSGVHWGDANYIEGLSWLFVGSCSEYIGSYSVHWREPE